MLENCNQQNKVVPEDKITMDFSDIVINGDLECDLKEGASEIVSRLRPEWGLRAHFKHKVFSDGLTNKLIGVYIESCKEDMILVRVYGHNSDLMIDRKSEIKNMQLLYSNGCGPQLYATFQNGLAYQYLVGSTLTLENVCDSLIFPAVAAAFAKMHSIKLPPEQSSNRALEPCIWNLLRKFHKLSPEGFPDSPGKDAALKAKIPFTKAELANEIKTMETLLGEHSLKNSDSKIVFSHNDLMSNNAILRYKGSGNQQQPEVSFIDYEYGDWNYREYDIADHFNEFVGMGDENGFFDYDKYYPSKAFQLEWIEAYLTNLNGTDKRKNLLPSKNEIEEIQALVEKFRPLPNLLWGIWSLIQSKYSTIDFDFIEYASQRLKEYKKRR